MKRLFTLLAALMLTVTASFAQQNFYFWEKNGNVSIDPVSEVDSLTFSVGSWFFQISKPVNLGATTSSFQGSAKVAFNDKVKSIDVTPEVGICYSDENRTPNYYDFKKKLGSTMQDYSFTIMNVASGTTYYYRTYVKLLDEVYYSAVNSITTMGEKPQNTLINGHEFVDLGLPSGLLWAKTNVGAASSSDDGDYFAWGETASKSYYEWDSYKWNRSCYKYNSSDGKTTLDSEDDAATVNWGAPCRMPDTSEFQELCSKCDWSWQPSYKGTSGYLVKGPNGRTIFFPASGRLYAYNLCDHAFEGYYWSRSHGSFDTSFASSLYFRSGNVTPSDNWRCNGYTVRPVAEKKSQEIVINGHEFVDLGLPSGLLWAKTNVGAASSSDDGDYFAWGETEPKSHYDWDTYKWGKSRTTLSKYNSSDGKTTLDAEDDAATVNWGTPWRMPDASEFQELLNKCDISWKSNYNGTSGYLVTGPNGNTIFFPVSGLRHWISLYAHGSEGCYWSLSLYVFSDGISGARYLDFRSDYVGMDCSSSSTDGLAAGFTVRPVAK